MTVVDNYNIYVGSSTGAFKGVSLHKDNKCTIKNIQNVRFLTNKASVVNLNWGNSEESEIIVAYNGQKIKIYDTDFKNFNTNTDVSFGHGEIVGVSRYDECILTAVQSGHVKLWRYKTEEDQWSSFNVGTQLESMKHNKDTNVIATGGKENDLKIWDLNTTKNIFSAKNVKPDEFDLRRPVWVNDIAFLPASDKVAVCSKQGYVRIYDPKVTSQRRPVLKVDVPDQAFSCISATSQSHYVVVGTTQGGMLAIDLRGKGKPCYKYKGFAGTVKSIAFAPAENLLFSVSLDRHFRVHDFHSKKLLRRDYMQSRLTSILVRSDFSLEKDEKKPNEENEYSGDRVEYGETDEMYDPEHHEMNNAHKTKQKSEENEYDESDSDLEIVEEIVEKNEDEERSEESEVEDEEEEEKDEGDSDNDEYYTESEEDQEVEESSPDDEMFPLADKKGKKRKFEEDDVVSEKSGKMNAW